MKKSKRKKNLIPGKSNNTEINSLKNQKLLDIGQEHRLN